MINGYVKQQLLPLHIFLIMFFSLSLEMHAEYAEHEYNAYQCSRANRAHENEKYSSFANYRDNYSFTLRFMVTMLISQLTILQ